MLEARVRIRRRGFVLDVALQAGEGVTAVLGPSGSGKTTLLHCVAGLLRLEEGRVALEGRVLEDTEAGIRLAPERRGVGLVFQDLRLFPHMSVRENLLFGKRDHCPEGPRFREVAGLLELEPLLGRMPAALSGGQARRVALGRALLSSPRLLLLDEPLAGLDVELAGKLLPYLVRVREALRVPALYVTHDPGEVMAMADRVVVLRDGRVAAQGAPGEVLYDPAVFPLARARGIENVLRGRVVSVSEEGAVVQAADYPFHVAATDLRVGEGVMLGIRSRDLILGLGELPGLSVRNDLEGVVEEVHALGGRALAYVRAGVRWVVELTPHSADEMGLVPGKKVRLLVKAAAIDVLRGGD